MNIVEFLKESVENLKQAVSEFVKLFVEQLLVLVLSILGVAILSSCLAFLVVFVAGVAGSLISLSAPYKLGIFVVLLTIGITCLIVCFQWVSRNIFFGKQKEREIALPSLTRRVVELILASLYGGICFYLYCSAQDEAFDPYAVSQQGMLFSGVLFAMLRFANSLMNKKGRAIPEFR